ncbi:LOW QUALITY PROTEIN: hypothetical protein OSB04_006064 [Centaurea solstitialis]|uniref:Uncharacterized protein n=1 Tax=Centaurea solstitialis TaxID=347529 RepID=A0AA38TIZ0_9ASTR|nr:LOW QUALITY PROTEIN: hypothetical protein OSB04_006064 [Centaurea solstitialis]
MARSFSNAKRLSSFFGNQLSVGGALGGGASTMKKGAEESSKPASKLSDPSLDGHFRPEFRSNQVFSLLNFIRPFSSHVNAYKSQIPSIPVSKFFPTASTPSAASPAVNYSHPLSPHLSIYPPQSNSMFSISNRIASIYLLAAVVVFYLLCMKTGLICLTYNGFYQMLFGISGLTDLVCYSAIPPTILHLLHYMLFLFDASEIQARSLGCAKVFYGTGPPIVGGLIIFFISFTYINYSTRISSEEAIKEPLHPQQILPLLPDQVSLSIPRPSSFRGILDFHVIYVASAKIADDSKLPWKGSCFNENTAWLELHNKSGTQFGGGTITILRQIKANRFIKFEENIII